MLNFLHNSPKPNVTVIRFLRTSIKLEPEKPLNRKALRVAVIGPPNVGKSAITNEIIRADLCAVSKRMDTTRFNTVAAITENSCQLVVVDSPGIVGIKHAREVVGAHSESSLLTDSEKAISHAEHLLVIHDATLPGKYLSHRILHILHRYSHIPASLVINKTDLIQRQSDLLELGRILTNGMVGGQQLTTQPAKFGKLGEVKRNDEIKLHTQIQERDENSQLLYNRLANKPTYKINWGETRKLFGKECGWPNFDQLFFTSAVTKRGIDDLRNHLQSLSNPIEGEYPMSDESISLNKPRLICSEHIRSEILNHLPGNVAYLLRVNVLEWDVMGEGENVQIRIVADVICDKLQWAHLLAKAIPTIEKEVGKHLRNIFAGNIEIRIRPKYGRDVIGPKQKDDFKDIKKK